MTNTEKFKIANELSLEEAISIIKTVDINNSSASRSFAAHCQKLINTYCDESLKPNEQLYLLLNPETNRHCRVCGVKLTKFFGPSRGGWGNYCSIKCSTQSEERKKKYEETSLKKYGAAHPKRNNVVNEKAKNTNLERYGHVSNFHAPGSREIISQKIKNKLNETKEKIKNTCIERYGVATPLLSNKALQKIKQSHFKKIKERDKLRIEHLKEDGFELIELSDNLNHKWKHECGEIIQSLSVNISCPACKKDYHRSNIEIEIYEFIKAIRPDLTIIHSHTPFSGNKKEVDIFIEELKLGIEINGTYWHKAEFDNRAMLAKSEQAEQNGFQLIHIWDNEWNEKTKSFLISKISHSKKVYARNTDVKYITTKQSREFCELYHRQGAAGAAHHIGLFNDDELLSVLTIGKPRFDKSAEWEIIRLCTKHQLKVIGGLNKMLAHFQRDVKPSSISTYVDRSWGNGEVYRKAGFELVRKTEPGYFWTNSTGMVLSRYESQKKKLATLFGDKIDLSLPETEILKQQKFWKCENVGNYFFVKKF
jgi:very-short-patch-repair endonuclease